MSSKASKITEVSLLTFSEDDVTDLEDVIHKKLSISDNLEIFYDSKVFFLRIKHIRGSFNFHGEFGLLYLYLMLKDEQFDKILDAFHYPIDKRSATELVISDNAFPNGCLLGINEVVLRFDSVIQSGKMFYPKISLAYCNYDNEFNWDY